MRIAFLPPFRIAAGLLLVVLLGVVGCQFLRWRNPVAPEAILARAGESYGTMKSTGGCVQIPRH